MTGYQKKNPEIELSEEDLKTINRLKEQLDTLEKQAAITGRSVREFLISRGYDPSLIEVVLADPDEHTGENEYVAFVPVDNGKYLGVRKGVAQDEILMPDQKLRDFFDKEAKRSQKPLPRSTNKKNHLIRASIAVLVVAIIWFWPSEWFEKTFHPKRYWEQRVEELEHRISVYQARLIEYSLALSNKPNAMTSDVQSRYTELIVAGMKPDEAWKKAVEIETDLIKAYGTMISVCNTQLDKTRAELEEARVELVKCQ